MVIDVGEQPTPEIEPAEPPPGGIDAVEDALYNAEPVVPDLFSHLNPHVAVPDSVLEGEDTGTVATSGDGTDAPEESTA